MDEWEDYYKILQVHYLAEPEVIEGAYKKLLKKYHPDVNKEHNAEEVMKLINRAYEVLGDPVSRKQYLFRWIEKHSGISGLIKEQQMNKKNDFLFHPAKEVLLDYLKLISEKKLNLAYELLSETDKKYIKKKDFIKWQIKVSEVFDLKSYECFVKNNYSSISIRNCFYELLVEFRVKVTEMNNVMDRLEEDEFSKSVVLENNNWRVFLGYRELEKMINKFDELISLKKMKFSEKKRIQKIMNIDNASELLNKKGFNEKAKKEQDRHNRYGNVFSIILCEIDESKRWNEIRYNAIRLVGKGINTCLRGLDISCRWKGKKFLLLLPETNSVRAKSAVCKIQKTVNELFYAQGEVSISMSFAISTTIL